MDAVVVLPFGTATLHAEGERLAAVRLRAACPPRPPPPGTVLAEAADQLRAYTAGRLARFDLPLTPVGTPFQRAVWDALRALPWGARASYATLAAGLGRPPGAARAIGGACAANPWLVVVPCHRVVPAAGGLGGYAGGADAKAWLLDHEARTPPAAR